MSDFYYADLLVPSLWMCFLRFRAIFLFLVQIGDIPIHGDFPYKCKFLFGNGDMCSIFKVSPVLF